ncbi:MAG: hypothetical protein DWQ34_20975 [Planctomycetota bacterium]|nr:MAG: hypothetical protein DWQ34_20975 [Planctomycetota bacterium]REK21628.1 MAG: hypothetical protein DWQ41_20795 [Planctomycetota bacterium]REK29979.1 MAG: hypothetical protein DWQ45_22140 [Planctomycetota bacterium]
MMDIAIVQSAITAVKLAGREHELTKTVSQLTVEPCEGGSKVLYYGHNQQTTTDNIQRRRSAARMMR